MIGRTRLRLGAILVAVAMATPGCGSATPGTAAAAPPPSAGHALVFDDSLGSVLLVNAGLGGPTPPPATARTILWRWTGRQWVVVDSTGPPVRNLGGVAYDSRRDVLVLFGGTYDQDHVYDDTWEWARRDGWRRRNVPGPGPRDHTEMAYDAERGRVVLFGGQVGVDSFPADTWTWDGSAWERLEPKAGPPPRVHHTMAYDPRSRRVLLFGGIHPPRTPLGDTWAWTGTERTVAAPEVYPRTHARLAVTSRGVVLVGGFPARASPTLLRLDGDAWQRDEQPGNPGERYLTAAAYDPVRRVTVLYGGSGPPMDSLYSDTWEYSAPNGWRRVSTGRAD